MLFHKPQLLTYCSYYVQLFYIFNIEPTYDIKTNKFVYKTNHRILCLVCNLEFKNYFL